MRPPLCPPEQLEWEKTCPRALTSDVLWKLDVCRAAFFLLHLSRADIDTLATARHHEGLDGQLARAAGSISANIGEGYSRATRAERLRFLGYALGSCRECLSWYEAARGALDDPVISARLELLTRIRALLLGLIRSIRDTARVSGHFER